MQYVYGGILLIVIFLVIKYLRLTKGRSQEGKITIMVSMCIVMLLTIVYYENLKQTGLLLEMQRDAMIYYNKILLKCNDIYDNGLKAINNVKTDLNNVLADIQTLLTNTLRETGTNIYNGLSPKLTNIYDGVTNVSNDIAGISNRLKAIANGKIMLD